MSRLYILSLLLLVTACSGNSRALLTFEARIKNIDALPERVEYSFVKNGSMSSGTLYQRDYKDKQPVEINGFQVFSESGLLHRDKGNNYVVLTPLGENSEVYKIDVPKNLKPQQYSPWQMADFIESSKNTAMKLLKGRNLEIPKEKESNSKFEIRYKIEKWKLPL